MAACVTVGRNDSESQLLPAGRHGWCAGRVHRRLRSESEPVSSGQAAHDRYGLLGPVPRTQTSGSARGPGVCSVSGYSFSRRRRILSDSRDRDVMHNRMSRLCRRWGHRTVSGPGQPDRTHAKWPGGLRWTPSPPRPGPRPATRAAARDPGQPKPPHTGGEAVVWATATAATVSGRLARARLGESPHGTAATCRSGRRAAGCTGQPEYGRRRCRGFQ